jgi:hypothetical protein
MNIAQTYNEFLNESAGKKTDVLKHHFDRTNMSLAQWIKDHLLPSEKLETEADAIRIVGKVNSKQYYTKLPAMYFFDSPAEDYSSNNLIIHFARSERIRDGILQRGFIYGEPDYLKLGMNWSSRHKPKREEGFNYGLDYDDMLEKYGTLQKAAKHWGSYPISFKATDAIKNYHFGDDVEQVLFWGPSAYDIKLIS